MDREEWERIAETAKMYQKCKEIEQKELVDPSKKGSRTVKTTFVSIFMKC